MKVKKVISLALAAAAAVSAMSGCAKDESKSGKYVIDWYHVTGTPPVSTEEVEKAVNEYLDGKLDAELKLHFLDWATFDQKIATMTSGQEKFDICYTSSSTYSLNAVRNAYVELDDLLDNYAPKTKELLGEDFINGARINGKIYGIQANKDKGSSYGIFYRKDLAEKYNLTEQLENAKTLEDLYPALDVIKANEPDIAPLYEFSSYSNLSLLPIDEVYYPVAINYEKDPNKIVNLVDTDEFKEGCRKVTEHMKKGYLVKGYDAETEKHFIEFQVLKPEKDAELNASRDYEWKQVEMTAPVMTNKSAKGSLMAVSRTSKNPEICVQFLEMFNTDPYLNNLIIYGIEGKDYEKVGDNTIKVIPNSGYGNAGMQWEFGNTFINYTVEGENPEKSKLMEEFNATLKPLDSLGFVFDATNVETQAAACQNVVSEFKGQVVAGEANVDELLDQYISKLKASGVDDIVAEAQKQYDAWRQSK